jgi:hypothetical protein
MAFFDEQDLLELDIADAIETYRAGGMTQMELYDTLCDIGLTNSEISASIHAAMADKWHRRMRDLRVYS